MDNLDMFYEYFINQNLMYKRIEVILKGVVI